jgi:hypothetical protein
MKLGWLSIGAGTVAGILLTFMGATRPMAPLFYSHIFLCLFGVVFLLTGWAGTRGRPMRTSSVRFVAFLGAALLLGTSAWAMREGALAGEQSHHQSVHAPESQDYEGQGVNGDFLPEFCSNEYRPPARIRFLMRSDALRALPLRYLQAVEQFSASLLLLQ